MLAEDFHHKRSIFQADGLNYSSLRILTTDGSSAMVLYRLMRWLKNARLGPLAYAVQLLNKLINQCVIGTDTQFGAGFVIMHPVGIVMNSRVKGGERVVLESGVVVGSEKGLTPVLGDDIFVGAGAKIIGGIVIGNGAKVGANAVVVKDVPEKTTVVGIPAKPICRRESL